MKENVTKHIQSLKLVIKRNDGINIRFKQIHLRDYHIMQLATRLLSSSTIFWAHSWCILDNGKCGFDHYDHGNV